MNKQRNTYQKTLVCETVMSMTNHPSADMVYEQVAKKCSSISRATVFRILNQLAENNVILKIKTPQGADAYDFNTKNHYHFKCIECKGVFDIDMPYINNIEDMIKNDNGHKILSHDISFFGICDKCNKINK